MIDVVAEFHRPDRPEPRLAGPAGDDDHLLHGLPGQRTGAGQPLGLLPGLGVRRRRPLPPRAALRDRSSCRSRSGCSSRASSSASSSCCRSRLTFLLQFNVWLGVAPTLRLSDWMSFATILPAGLRPLLPDAAGHALPGADRHLHGRRLPGEAEDRDPDHHDRRRRADARARTRSACSCWPSR